MFIERLLAVRRSKNRRGERPRCVSSRFAQKINTYRGCAFSYIISTTRSCFLRFYKLVAEITFSLVGASLNDDFFKNFLIRFVLGFFFFSFSE